jgi:hypothetical protein
MVGRVRDLTGSTTRRRCTSIGGTTVLCALIVMYGLPQQLRESEKK